MTTNNNDPNITVDVDATYTFEISEKTIPDFKMAASISQWLVTNLSNLTDDHDKKIFNKVNTGFNESSIRKFGSGPVCDVYIDSIEYETDFNITRPINVNSIVIFYMKGAKNNTYFKACQLHDYIMQSFIENENWRVLNGYVSNTFITNSQLMNQPIQKKWGIMGAFELTHKLF